ALLGAAGPRPSEAAKNLLVNPDFEQAIKGHDWMPAGWDTSQAGMPSVFFGRDSSTAHAGHYSVNVASASALLPLAHNWSQSMVIGKESWGRDLVFTVWTRSVGVDGRAYVKLEAYRDTISKMAKLWNVDRESAANRLRIQALNDPLIDLGWRREFFSEPETGWIRHQLRLYVA